MRRLGLLFSCCLLVGVIPALSQPADASDDGGCATIQDALKVISSLKPGDSRARLEKDFELDGGMQFVAHSHYVFRKCHYIKVDVELSGDGIERRAEFSPGDEIVHISKPYLEYPVTD